MIKAWYTGASGMRAQQWRLDAISNNLANVDSDAYKKDVTSFKSFPEMLMRRMDDDGIRTNPLGSWDVMPVIGKLGTGVELNELYTDFQQGSMKETQSDYDLALDGKGFFAVQTPLGERYTRNGSFHLGKEGLLLTKEGYPVLGENGPLHIQANNFQVDKMGRVWINAAHAEDPTAMVSREGNTWEDTVLLDVLKIVDFDIERYLEKEGSSLYRTNNIAGEAEILPLENRPRVIQGFVESSNVDAVREMVQMIEVNRAYEANQKVVQAGDTMLNVLISQVARA